MTKATADKIDEAYDDATKDLNAAKETCRRADAIRDKALKVWSLAFDRHCKLHY